MRSVKSTYPHLADYSFPKPTGSNHPHIRVASETDPLAHRPTAPRGGGDPAVQILHDGRRVSGVCGRAVARGAERGDDADRARFAATAACGVEHELSESCEGVCESAGVFVACAGTDVVCVGEEGGGSVFGTGADFDACKFLWGGMLMCCVEKSGS